MERLWMVLSKWRGFEWCSRNGEALNGALKTGETWARRCAQMLESIATNCNEIEICKA
jgi:hypothetical protein